MLRRSLAWFYHKANHLSPVTNVPFPEAAQPVLTRKAKDCEYKSRYWVTGIQAWRVFGVKPRPKEQPTQVAFDIDKVVSLGNLSLQDQQKILDEHPPYFAGGIGMFGGARKRWLPVASSKLRERLNTEGKERSLWICEKIVEEWGLAMKAGAKAVSVGSLTYFDLFNAEQLDTPERVQPLQGLALSALTGKRFPQPAHDQLVALAVARGYKSPFWLTAHNKQSAAMFGTKFKPGFEKHEVIVPNSVGKLVNYSALPAPLRNLIHSKLPPVEAQPTYYQILGCGGWESVRRASIVDELFRLKEKYNFKYPKLWVNIDELQLFGTPAELDKFFKATPGYKLNNAAMADLGQLSKIKLINASMTEAPQFVLPKSRELVIRKGKLLGGRTVDELRQVQKAKNYQTSLWVSKAEAKQLGVKIRPGEEGVLPGRDLRELEEVYNIDDFIDADEEIFKRYPPLPSTGVHAKYNQIFAATTWRYEKTVNLNKALQKQGRERKFWITATEILYLGFPLKQDAKPIKVSKAKGVLADKEKDAAGVTGKDSEYAVYNAEQTTDPVRVMALMNFFARPKGNL